jgi:hypothetical protein
MMSLIRKRLVVLGAGILFVLIAAVILTAFSGKMVKAYLEKGSDRFRVGQVSFGWGTIEGHEIRILDNGQEVARAKLVAIRPSLLTFFRKGFTLSRVIFEEPTLTLTITKENHITTPFSKGAEGERQKATPFHVGLLKIKNGILTINDQRQRKPGQLQVYNVNLSVGSFSYPLSDEPSTLHASAQLSGKALSGLISTSGAVNLKSGLLKLDCVAEGLKALEQTGQKPQIQVEKLSFKAESPGGTPVTISDVKIEKPYYRYASQQKREIRESIPGLERGKQAKRESEARPVALVRGIAIKDGEIVISDSSGAKNATEISVVDVSLSLGQFALPFDDTRSFFDLSGHIPGRQNTANLRWSGTTAFGTLDTDSRLSLQSLDLTLLRPYFEKKGDVPVAGGTVDVGAHVKINNHYMDTPVTVTIRHLQLASARGLRDQFMGVPRSILLNSMKTRNEEIRIDFVVSGPMDSPSFNLRENMTKRFAIALAKSLGLSAFGAGETVVEQGARAVQGAGKGIKSLGEGVKRLFGR